MFSVSLFNFLFSPLVSVVGRFLSSDALWSLEPEGAICSHSWRFNQRCLIGCLTRSPRDGAACNAHAAAGRGPGHRPRPPPGGQSPSGGLRRRPDGGGSPRPVEGQPSEGRNGGPWPSVPNSSQIECVWNCFVNAPVSPFWPLGWRSIPFDFSFWKSGK